MSSAMHREDSPDGVNQRDYPHSLSRRDLLMDTIGFRVKQIRKLHNLNQIDFSNALGISQGRLSEIEQDKTKPSADTIIALKQVFNVDLNWLLSFGSINEDKRSLHAEILSLIDGLQLEQLQEVVEFIKFKRGYSTHSKKSI